MGLEAGFANLRVDDSPVAVVLADGARSKLKIPPPVNARLGAPRPAPRPAPGGGGETLARGLDTPRRARGGKGKGGKHDGGGDEFRATSNSNAHPSTRPKKAKDGDRRNGAEENGGGGVPSPPDAGDGPVLDADVDSTKPCSNRRGLKERERGERPERKGSGREKRSEPRRGGGGGDDDAADAADAGRRDDGKPTSKPLPLPKGAKPSPRVSNVSVDADDARDGSKPFAPLPPPTGEPAGAYVPPSRRDRDERETSRSAREES
jgi:hypothetical protein